MDFWESKYGHLRGAVPQTEVSDRGQDEYGMNNKTLSFETHETARNSDVLANVRDPVSDGLMSRIVGVWTRKWTAELKALDAVA